MAAKGKGSKPAKAIKDLKPNQSAAQSVKGGYVPRPNVKVLGSVKRKIWGANPK